MNYKKLVLLSATMLLTLVVYCQNNKATIGGFVKDARTKLPLTEAVITLSSTALQGQKFALTDSTGRYRIKNLPAGNYTIVFEMEGYRRFRQDSIALGEGMSLGISFQMVTEEKINRKKKSVANEPAEIQKAEVGNLDFL